MHFTFFEIKMAGGGPDTKAIMQKMMIIGPTKKTPGECDGTYVWSLQHPRYPGRSLKYMIKNGEIMEMQRVEPIRYSSFFMGQYVHSDGAIFVVSRIDPCFLLLPILKQGTGKYALLSQILTTAASDLRSLVDGCELGLERLCDVKDLDEDGMFYRINHEKVLQWLKAKVERVADKLCKLEQKEMTASNGFADGFSLGSEKKEEGGGVDLKVSGAHMSAGLEMVCEYLDEDSAETLRLSYADCPNMRQPSEKRPADSQGKEANKWNNTDVDDMTALAYGQPKKAKTEISAVNSTQTVKNKSLGKVPPKGMKSMASYFGKKT